MDAPFGFDVELDRELFSLDRLDALYRRGVAAGNAGAQSADPGFERREDPPLVPLQRSLAEEVADAKLHVWFRDVTHCTPRSCSKRRGVVASIPARAVPAPPLS